MHTYRKRKKMKFVSLFMNKINIVPKINYVFKRMFAEFWIKLKIVKPKWNSSELIK